MASEALEKSLRAEIEKHFNSSLNELRGEITRLQNLLQEAVRQHQSETNSAIAKLMESFSGENEAIVAAITEQLRTTREGVGQALSATPTTGGNDALIRNAIVEFSKQKSQAEILKTLVSYSASLAPRVAFFIVKDGHTKGWRARGFESTVGNESIVEIALPLTAQTLLSEAVKSQMTWDGEPGHMPDDYKILNSMGPVTPKRTVAVPLVARGRSVAVLYADSGREDTSLINLDALESLSRVAGMSVELLASGAAARPAVTQAATPAQAATSAPQPEPEYTGPTVAPKAQPEPAPEQVAEEPQPEPTPSWEEVSYQPPVHAEPVEEEISYTPTPAPEEQPVEYGYTTTPMATPTPAPAYTAPVETYAPVEPAPERPTYSQATPTQTTPATPASSASASARSYARKDIDLPIEVGEEERRYHNEARRFARLLVSEIKLYNEPRVKEGREAGDLYDRLREAIDRSREMYDKRVHHLVASRFDYFHFELVNTLAEGDEGKLGSSYPGSVV